MKTVVSKEGKLVLVDWIPVEETDKMRESRGDVDYCKIGYDREYYLLNQPCLPIHPHHTDYFTPYIGKEIPDGVWEMEKCLCLEAFDKHSCESYNYENKCLRAQYAIPKQPEGDEWESDVTDFITHSIMKFNNPFATKQIVNYIKSNYTIKKK